MEEWTVQQCAEHVGIKASTWRSYVARDQAPQPIRRIGATPVWDAAQIRAWRRPGQGSRTDLKAQPDGEP